MSGMIAPSILSADFGKLYEEIDMINRSEADWFHVDVMDGVFVPNISFGFPVMKPLLARAQKPLDVHLMIVDPDRYTKAFADAGAHILTVHVEACTHLHRTLTNIKQHNMKAGVAINPHTPVESIKEVLYLCDVVCLMSVNPGFGGQSFIENTYQKVRTLKAMIDAAGTQTLIEIDGGVVLGSTNPTQTITDLKQLIK
jgi:ribulose-phosphate 3-epimerase